MLLIHVFDFKIVNQTVAFAEIMLRLPGCDSKVVLIFDSGYKMEFEGFKIEKELHLKRRNGYILVPE